jgi:CO/xanthine dehydrogenase Mo-binding subunit
VKLDRSGRVTVFSGASDIGQGSNSVPAYILAEELGCLPEDVVAVVSDTDLTPVDMGAYSSRVTFMMGLACIEAAQKLRAQLFAAVAEAWGTVPGNLAAELGTYREVNGTRAMAFVEAVKLAEAKFGTLGSTGSYRTQKLGGDYRGGTIGASPAYSFTAHVAEVQVDEETGVIQVDKLWIAHDCGRALNPALVEGQMEGSAYMGYAEALFEEQSYTDKGLHKGPSLLDYRIPTTLDTPDMQALIVESIDPNGPYGAKEAGEGPLHPSIPAISNAVWRAVGIRLTELPFTPARVLRLLKAQRERLAAVAKTGS